MSFDLTPQLRGRDHENDSNVSSPIHSSLRQPSCFQNLARRSKATTGKKSYVPSHGSNESFAYVSPGHRSARVHISLSAGLTRELNETVTPPNTTRTSDPQIKLVGRSARVMRRHQQQSDPLDRAQQQQNGGARVPISSSAIALRSSSHRNLLGYGNCSLQTKRSQLRAQSSSPIHDNDAHTHAEVRTNFNTPKSNDNSIDCSDSQSSSLIQDDDDNCNHKKASGSSSGNSSSVFGSTSEMYHRNSYGITSSTPRHSGSRTSSSDSRIVAEVIEIDKSYVEDEKEVTSSTEKSNREEHTNNNRHQKGIHHLNNKKKNQFKKRSYGNSAFHNEPSKGKGTSLNKFSKVNGMRDTTQIPPKKKVKAIVPGESLSTRQSFSGQTFMDNDTLSYGNDMRDSTLDQPIPRKIKNTNSRNDSSWNVNSSQQRTRRGNDDTFDDNGWRASTESAKASRISEGKSNGIQPDKFHPTRNREYNTPSILETVVDVSKAMVTKGTRALSKIFPALSPSVDQRPVTRSSAKKNQKKNDVVVIDDSDDDVQEILQDTMLDEHITNKRLSSRNTDQTPSQEFSAVQQTTRIKRLGDRQDFSLVRIAIGEKVFSHNCSMQFQTGTNQPFINLSFSDNATDSLATKNIPIPLHYDSIQEMAYSLQADDDSDNDKITFLAIRLVLPQSRGHNRSAKMYLDELMGCGQFRNLRELCESNIVCEIRDELDFKEKLPMIHQNSDILQMLLTEEANIRSAEKALQYTSVLIKQNELDKKARLESSQSPQGRTRSVSSKTLTVKEKQRILLVYPFIGGPRIEKVAQELDIYTRSFPSLDEDDNEISSEKLLEIQKEAAGGRTHILTITVEDRDRLEPGEFLNDTLIDFWMRWISRKDPLSKSCVHFFTSHFYTTLRVEGVNAVSSWTSKKGIDIFSKSIIFLPINQTLHWSLCAVMNPGTIQEVVDVSGESSDDHAAPCIIFLDSLKAHQKATVAKHVRIWLNHEYKKKFGGEVDVFTTESMKVYAPKVPYQNNSWDCGVFVCQYANALYQQRHHKITYKDLYDMKPPLVDIITKSPYMDFDMDYIAHLRKEMGKLVDKLSTVYLDVKGEMAEEKKEDKQPKSRESLPGMEKQESFPV